MARVCMFTGKKTAKGATRSHSMRSTKRSFKANILTKNIDLGDGVKMKVKICASAYKKLRGFIV